MGNFPAPPHDETGHTWHHADQWLFDIVKHGGKHHAPPRYRSAMPAYHDMLSDAEIWAVLAFIKSRWPTAIGAAGAAEYAQAIAGCLEKIPPGSRHAQAGAFLLGRILTGIVSIRPKMVRMWSRSVASGAV